MGNEYYAHEWVENPDLVSDLRKYFFEDLTEEQIVEKLETHDKRKLSVIVDRYEFISKLEDLKEIFLGKRVLSDPILTWIEVDGEKLIKVEKLEKIQLEEKEFNGITYDIEALLQYLLLTCIDTVLGSETYLTFPEWLRKNGHVNDLDIEKISGLYEEYADNNGLRKLFFRGFNSLSTELKSTFVDTFLLVKLDNGKLNDDSFARWQELDADDKFKKLSRFFYDQVRCKFTHESSRHMLPYKNVTSRKATRKAVLVSCLDPKEVNLINLLKKSVVELTRKEFDV